MTREEEIKQAANNFCPYEKNRIGFLTGAKWADENPKSQWISVEDKLPPLKETVLAVIGRTIREMDWVKLIEVHDNGEQYWVYATIDESFDNQVGQCITHWMPVPEFPDND